MKTEFEKLRARELTDTSDKELRERLISAKRKQTLFNQSYFGSNNYRELLEELLPNIPASSIVSPPFYCDYGDGIILGENVFINSNCSFLDGGFITIGKHTLVGPNVQIYTPHHPLDYLSRRETKETSYPVTIGEDCWIGGGTTICPGVTIGDRVVIGAGSVVVKDIASDSVAVGNPAKVVRKTQKKEAK